MPYLDKDKRGSISLKPDLKNQLIELAEKENRSLSGQAVQLIEEALAYREEIATAKVINSKLPQLATEELSEVIIEAGKLIKKRTGKGECRPGNAIALAVKENLGTCSKVFSELGDGDKKLQAILEGYKPSEKELILLNACLPVDGIDLIDIFDQEFTVNG